MDSNERNKLKTLLNYWIEHNREHSQEFQEWADKAKVMGEVKVAEEILQAVRAMDNATALLSRSLKRLEEA
jgi:nickel/cobalt exporter